jgi:hypothetical protein
MSHTTFVTTTTAEYRDLVRAKHIADCREAFLKSDRFDDYGIGRSELEILRMLFVSDKESGAK